MESRAPLLVVDDVLFDEHQAPLGHPERPERLVAARQALASIPASTTRRLEPRDATEDELARVHEEPYVRSLSGMSGQEGYLDADTYFSARSAAAALRAAGGAIALADALVAREAQAGVALLRPPGHHATPSGAMGFCLLNNVAIAARSARALGTERVAIVDWDVHHGNGTQDAFYGDPSVLYVSLHQYPFYPGSGSAAEIGTGEGRGYTVNVPLSAGADDAVYAAAFTRIVGPVVEGYRPDLLLISAGFDAHARDPLAEMCLSAAAFARMTSELLGATAGRGAGVGLLLEGGYDLVGLRESLAATLATLGGQSAPPAPLDTVLGPRHMADLARATAALSPFWQLG